MEKPVILFSLPRSGSTLVQRILAVHDEIETVSEPWLLLPLVYALKKDGTRAEYSHSWSWQAINDFLNLLPDGKQSYLECIGNAVMALYAKASNKDVRYFLDKTPRYALISDDLLRTFPDGKFIFLWRNPLAVIASMIEIRRRGRWNIYVFKVDLFDGMQRLLDCYEKNSETVLAVRYEALLQAPESEIRRVMNFLDLDFYPGMLEKFAEVRLHGQMGDQTGIKEYNELSTTPLDKWKSTLNNPLRRIWCRRYLRWIGEDRLRLMGYELDELISELNATKTSWATIPGDVIQLLYGLFYCLLDIHMIIHKLGLLTDWKRVKRYS